MVTSRQIRKVNRDIAKIELKIENLEDKLVGIKEQKEQGKITKAKHQKAKMNISTKIRALRTAIARKKKARATFEKRIRDKQAEEEEDSL